MHDLDGLARNRIGPVPQHFVGLWIEIEHDLAANHPVAGPALGIGHGGALTDIHPFDVKQMTVAFARPPPVDPTGPAIHRGRTVLDAALRPLGYFDGIGRLGRIQDACRCGGGRDTCGNDDACGQCGQP